MRLFRRQPPEPAEVGEDVAAPVEPAPTHEEQRRDPFEELRVGFTAAVSHELRTPLARVLALVESAALPEGDPRAALEQVRAEVIHMSELVDDVLFLSELETGREVVALASTRAAPVLLEIVEELRERAERAGVRLEPSIDDEAIELPLRARMLRIVLDNLAQNALRHAGEGAMCVLALRRGGDEVVLEAADNGVGVAEADLPRLFERFYRADRSRATRGTGLGLAIVKHVVEAAGGSVEADGGRGRGLVIRCRFPS